MYSSDFICTYKMMRSDEDKEHLYRIQLLQAFDMNEWDDKRMEKNINDLYLKIKEQEQFRLILDAAKDSPKLGMMLSVMYQNDKDACNKIDALIFIILFNFDYFDLFHKCICEHINEGKITRTTFEEIMNRF